jgi:hypothetical protein
MNVSPVPDVVGIRRPVFVLGERAPALQLVQTLGQTPTLQAVPANRLLPELLAAAERCTRRLDLGTDLDAQGLRPARWYGDFQAAQLRASGKTRTVEFSGLSILRLCHLFSWGQFVLVRHLERAIPRSRRVPAPERDRILEIDYQTVDDPETLERVLAFLDQRAEALVLDLSDRSAVAVSSRMS